MIIKTTFNKFLAGLLSLFLLFNCCSQNAYSSKFLSCIKDTAGGSSSDDSLEAVERKPKLVVITIPGMGMNSTQFDTIRGQLRAHYGDSLVFIDTTYREERVPLLGVSCSMFCPISFASISSYFSYFKAWGLPTQVNKVAQEIKSKLKKNNIQVEKDKIILLTISQGAVVGSLIARDYKKLNVQAVISVAGALGGVRCLQNTIDHVNEFLSNSEAGLKEIGFNDEGIECIKSASESQLRDIKYAFGIQDMFPGSSCIKKVKQFVDGGTIPCLLIGSYISDIFNSLKNYSYHPVSAIQNPDVATLNKAFARLVTGSENGYHDGLISTDSQLLIEKSRVESLQEDIMQQDTENKNLYRVLLKGSTHAGNIVPIISCPEMLIDTNKTPVIEHDPRVPQHIINFINEVTVVEKE